MSRKRTGVGYYTDHGEPDPRFPQPQSPTPTQCQLTPQLFDRDYGDCRKEKELAKARRACSGCPLVTECLKWALVNEDLTEVGIWAATTPASAKRCASGWPTASDRTGSTSSPSGTRPAANGPPPPAISR